MVLWMEQKWAHGSPRKQFICQSLGQSRAAAEGRVDGSQGGGNVYSWLQLDPGVHTGVRQHRALGGPGQRG